MNANKAVKLFLWIYIGTILLFPILSLLIPLSTYLFEDWQINPFDYARITDVEYTAVVVDEPDSEGKVMIKERITFDVHAASRNNGFWELWRDLPEDNIDGVHVDYTVHSVKQILDDGTEIIYEESPKLYWDDSDYLSSSPYYGPGKWYHSEGPYDEYNEQYECVFFYIDNVYREEMTFEIVYEMHNAALRYNDCSDLYLSMYSGPTTRYLESYKAQILFPNKDMPSPGNYEVFTYGTNTNSFPVGESAAMHPGYYTFFFNLNEKQLKFRPYNNYIEFDLVSYNEDRHIFTEYAPHNFYSSDDVLDEIYEEQQAYANEPAAYRSKKIIAFILSIIGGICLFFYARGIDSRTRTKHAIYDPGMSFDYYREIPNALDPNFAATLVFCKHKPPKDNSGVYSAILLSLARKEYIELREYAGSNDIHITLINRPVPVNSAPMPIQPPVNIPRQMPTYIPGQIPALTPMQTMSYSAGITEPASVVDTREPLTLCEEYYFNLLMRHVMGNSISMKEFQRRVSSDYQTTAVFARNIESSDVNVGIKEGYLQKADYKEVQNRLLLTANMLKIIGLIFLILINLICYSTHMDLAFGGFTIFGISCLLTTYFIKKKAPQYVLLTQFGQDEYAKWRGLYNFLNSETLINERTVIELPLWEQYLVYATAFGLSQKVIKAIQLRCPEAVQSQVVNCSRSGRVHYHGRHFHSSVRSGSHSSYSGGGGFGYGGGGRGGGGGGGGH